MDKLALVLFAAGVASVLWSSVQWRATAEPEGEGIRIAPIPPAPPNHNQYIGFQLSAPWMEGHIRIRFPENIYTRMGTHFLDNLAPEVTRVSEVRVPVWEVDEKTGAISYGIETAEGIHFAGKAWVEGDVVHMEYRNRNTTGEPQTIGSQICFDMAPSPTFGERVTLDYTHAWFDGKYQSLNKTTSPKAAAKFEKNGYNWVLLLYKGDPQTELREGEDQFPWWIVDQMADYPIITRHTPDGKHLVALTWDHTVQRLMTNTNIPCLHTDTLHVEDLPDGAEKVWRGRVYAMEADPEKLLARCKADVTPKD